MKYQTTIGSDIKTTRLLIILSLLIANLQIFPTTALAEECPVIDFTKLGFGNQSISPKWKNADPVRVITWTSNASSIPPDQISTSFSATEEGWLQQAFDNYGEILDSVAFQRVNSDTDANISIGYTMLSKGKIPTETSGGNFGLWNFDPVRQKSGIQLLDPKLWPKNFKLFKSDVTFILPVQNEIGNVLGVPDVDPFGVKQSLITIYDTSKFESYGQLKINDFDAAIIRQLYGESTCNSKYSADARARNLAADKIAGVEYLKKAGLPQPAPITSTTTSAPNSSEKTFTISCIKGSVVKRVTAAKPLCPTGYKKK